MPQISVETTMKAPREAVFAMVTDFANAAEVIQGITRVEMLTDGPVGVGTRFRETRVMFGKEAKEVMEVVAMDAPKSYALGAESHGSKYHSEFTLQEVAEGTLVRMVFDAQPQTVFAKVMAVVTTLFAKKLAGMLLCDLNDVKVAVEAKHHWLGR